jgi:rhodanese-related sulfurtransferase
VATGEARVAPHQLREVIAAGGELAILDVREEGLHSRGHLFLASSAPLSTLELTIGRLVPRTGTPVVLIDDDERLAGRAAGVLGRLGYRDVRALAGGMAGWRQAGYEVYSGVHVPSKAFGEHVEHHENTPRISASELKARLDAGEDS